MPRPEITLFKQLLTSIKAFPLVFASLIHDKSHFILQQTLSGRTHFSNVHSGMYSLTGCREFSCCLLSCRYWYQYLVNYTFNRLKTFHLLSLPRTSMNLCAYTPILFSFYRFVPRNVLPLPVHLRCNKKTSIAKDERESLFTQVQTNTKTKTTMKKETRKFIIQMVISILTAIATTLGVTSCMGAL